MCGIAVMAGAVDRARMSVALARMKHRGPDGADIAARDGIILGHARLAIIDLSDAGHQPMVDADGNVLVYNGEIYNFARERERLARAHPVGPWKSQCDTEVLLQGLRFEGADFLSRLDGIFAFAWWHAARRELLVARDRLGVKPLYYRLGSDGLQLASEVQALCRLFAETPRVDPRTIGRVLRSGSVEDPETLFEGISAHAPGEWSRFHVAERVTLAGKGRFWTPPAPSRIDGDLVARTRAVVSASIESQLVSDAPIGIFLSGGVDSTIIASVASKRQKVRTLTVESDGSPGDAEVAAITARRLGTEHTTVSIRSDETGAWLLEAIQAQDLPSVDGLNTFVVSRAAARQGLRVALSGLGGDELFGGYALTFERLPKAQRLASFVRTFGLTAPVGALASLLWRNEHGRRAREILASRSRLDAYHAARALRSERSVRAFLPGWRDPAAEPVLESVDASTWVRTAELEHYMRNTLLRDSDVMGMANSLEIRVPLLGNEVVDLALAGGSATIDLRDGRKGLLRRAFAEELRDPSLSRAKTGFTVDVEGWMRGSGRDFVRASLDALAASGWVDRGAIEDEWNAFLGHRGTYAPLLSLVVLGEAHRKLSSAPLHA